MSAVRRIEAAERRARLGRRHRLAGVALADHLVEVARAVVGLHSSDPATVHLSAWARLRRPDHAAIDQALYDERSVIRMLGMRRTMFVVPADVAPIVQAACSDAIAAQERRRFIGMLEAAGIGPDVGRWLKEPEAAALRAIRARDASTTSEIAQAHARLRERIVVAQGKRYQAEIGVATRLLLVLAAEGSIVRGRPRGSWISSQYRWSAIDSWLPVPPPRWTTDEARTELVRLWLASFGPGTVADIRWWTGWTLGQTRRALSGVDTVDVELDGSKQAVVLADDIDRPPPSDPWVALLPGLDPTPMGWADRDWYLGSHRRLLFDTNGNVGPTIWADGRIVGGWSQRRTGEIACRLLEDIGTEATRAVEAAAERLRHWYGNVRATPRFRTPLERELSG